MKLEIEMIQNVTVIKLTGRLNSSMMEEVQAQVLPLALPDCRILLDMRELLYMSSAGLRILLLLSRQTASNDGTMVLVGLNDGLREVMSITGFLDYFAVYDTFDTGFAVLTQDETD